MALPSSSRNGQRVRLVVLHTAEGAQTNASLFGYFDRNQNASSHVGIDDAGISPVWVPYDRAAWTLRGGNPYSENAEMCAWARWTRAEWLAHDTLLSHAAAWVRSRCLARGIPIVKLSPADVKAGKAGVCGHADYTYGTGDGTHTDPGPNFPWDIVINRAKGPQTDWLAMATPDDLKNAVVEGMQQVLFGVRFADGRNFADEEAQQTGSVIGIQGQLDQVIKGQSAVVSAINALTDALLTPKAPQ